MVAGEDVEPDESGLTPFNHAGKFSIVSVEVRYVSLDSEPMVENVTLSESTDPSVSGFTCVRCVATSAGWNRSSECRYESGANWVMYEGRAVAEGAAAVRAGTQARRQTARSLDQDILRVLGPQRGVVRVPARMSAF